jgi:hypothetical protein
VSTLLPSYTEVPEPELRFHSTESRYHSINPMEGLDAWGPYDSSIPGYLRPNPLRLSVITPEHSTERILAFLNSLGNPVAHTSRDEYVVDWPGFRRVFQTNIELPLGRDHPLLVSVPEGVVEEARQAAQPEVHFLDVLKERIRPLLRRRHEFDVLIVHIPDRWREFRERREESYDFDLHDALKVHSAPNNLVLQIVEEDSLRYQDQARIMWWLGLALYVKAGGIPWKLAERSEGTAFVGLGYGITGSTDQGSIVIGCSQIFDEYGQGLKFLLYPVASPVFRGRNPFMSKEDSLRLFGRLREIYQQINGERPRRVVVHKTTHFSSDEIDGIAKALSGIEEIELLQIQQDIRWRMIAFDRQRQAASNFPVRRGTVVPLDRYSFLLWTQGDVPEIVGGGRHYYQEKRGIPSPLLIRRFRGTAPLELVAEECLRLTKMNWNNHQLYSRLPVTISFANELSQIAKQVRQVWRVPYDFRFFM